MKINVTIQRSDKWVNQRRIETGENVPQSIVVEIETTDLTIENRARTIGYLGSFDNLKSLRFDNTYSPNRSEYGYGETKFLIDSDSPTTEEINAAIAIAWIQLEKERVLFLEKEAERNAAREAKIAAEEEQKKKLAEARELLKSDLEERDNLKKRLEILGDFLSEVPLDALQGTAKKIAHSDEAIESLKEKIEDASPNWIFSRRDDEDE